MIEEPAKSSSEKLASLSERLASLRELMDERDQRYNERATASQEATALALAAQEKATASAFAAAKEAVLKAEVAQSAYNSRSNEFRQSLDDANKNNLSRTEADIRFKTTEKEINELREWKSGRQEAALTIKEARGQQNWVNDHALGILAILISVVGLILVLVKTAH